ncbi:MAG: hypothetical protein GY856_39165 [bacterium]|nr:hypothetical protein [bacterium]
MILLRKHRFGVAEYHQRVDPQRAGESFSQGLVVPVRLVFESWLDGEPCRADAFLDPGADCSIISLRWMREQAKAAGVSAFKPKCVASGYILEDIDLLIGDQRLPLSRPTRPVWIADQGDRVDSVPEMPGYEDLILGRDFIAAHGLFLLIDGERQDFTILAPIDSENKQKRQQILQVLDPQ